MAEEVTKLLSALSPENPEECPDVQDALWRPSKEEVEALQRGQEVEDRLVEEYRKAHPYIPNPRRAMIEGTVSKEAIEEGRAICARIDARKKAMKRYY